MPWGDWEEVPTGRLEKYLVALPRLGAERTLDRVQSVAAGSGVMQEQDHKQFMRSLQHQASGGKQTGVQKATVASLAQIGIAVETVPPPAEKKTGKRVKREVRDRG